MSEDDPVKRRAAQIRAEEAHTAAKKAARDVDIRAERVRLVRVFSSALRDRTPHSVQCLESNREQPHGAVAVLNFARGSKAGAEAMFEFGIDEIDGAPGSREFLYYLEPCSAAFSIANPKTGVARPIRAAPEQDVLDYAIAISIEMMARVVASGGSLGSREQIDEQLKREQRENAQRERERRQEDSRKMWKGCGMAMLWFFGIVIGIGLLGDLLRALGA